MQYTMFSMDDVTPEAQNAWQKVQCGLASAGNFIRDYGVASYSFLAGNITAGCTAGVSKNP